MIARSGTGWCTFRRADEYLDLMRIALPEYLATRRNRGAWCLHRTDADVTHFEMLTFWEDADAIKRFAGNDFSMAKYYEFDSDNLGGLRPALRGIFAGLIRSIMHSPLLTLSTDRK